MITLNIDYDVLPDRLVTIKLPETVSIGRHELVIVLEDRPLPPEVAKTQAERFIALINRERFDYTEWRKKQWQDETVESLAARARGLKQD